MTSFGYRIDNETGCHVNVTVWAGPDAEHRAYCGQLIMRPDESEAFRAMIDGHEQPRPITLASILENAGWPGLAEMVRRGDDLYAILAMLGSNGGTEVPSEIIEAWQKGEATR